MDSIKRYLWNLLIAIDQLGNALLAGDPDETISSRAYKHVKAKGRDSGLNYYLLLILEAIDPGHGRKTVEWDEGHGRDE